MDARITNPDAQKLLEELAEEYSSHFWLPDYAQAKRVDLVSTIEAIVDLECGERNKDLKGE